MTARDRTIVLVLGVVAVLGVFWFVLLAPKREDAKAADARLVAAQQRLDTANTTAAAAQAAKGRYEEDYAAVVRLGKAVPLDDDVPSLVYELETAARGSKIDFRSVKLTAAAGSASASTTTSSTPAAAAPSGGTSTTGTTSTSTSTTSTTSTATSTAAPATQAVTAALPPGASVGPAGFVTMPFAFTFDGTFMSMKRMLARIDEFIAVDGDDVRVHGRLLSIDGLSLQVSPDGFPHVRAEISATAYLLPRDQGLTNGATQQAPTALIADDATGASR